MESTERAERDSVRRPAGFNLADFLFASLCKGAAGVVILLAAAIVAVLVWKSWLAITTIGAGFLASANWDPNHRLFGSLAFIFGTIATSLIAMAIAVPLGVGSAAFLSEVATGWVRRVVTFAIEMLAAIPSVVYGFWGLFFLAPMLQDIYTWLGGPNVGGVGILSAGIILSIMIVPYVAAISYDVCRSVPRAQREGALALGATRWQMIWSVVLPYARPGIVGACFLALGRALGETMAVTMLIGNKAVLPDIHSLEALRNLPFSLGDTIASVIANQFTEATEKLYLSALVELGLLLFCVTVVVNALARLLVWRVGHGGGPRRSWFFKGRSIRPSAASTPDPAEEDADIPRPRQSNARSAERFSHFMTMVLALSVFATVAPLVLVLGYLIYMGIGSLSWEFFVNLPAPVGEAGGGMANAILGSAILVSLATLFAVPISLLAAVYLAEYKNGKLAHSVRFIGELLGGVPSIVIGIFAYAVVVVPMGRFSGWAGAFALAVMMVPIVMRAAEEALKIVPRSLRLASYALGASQWQTVCRVTLPAAWPAIVTGIFLAVARIAGETAPLLLTALSTRFWPRGPGDNMPSLPVYIYNYAISSDPDWHRQAWAAALVLLVVVMLLNFGIRFLTGKRLIQASHAD